MENITYWSVLGSGPICYLLVGFLNSENLILIVVASVFLLNKMGNIQKVKLNVNTSKKIHGLKGRTCMKSLRERILAVS